MFLSIENNLNENNYIYISMLKDLYELYGLILGDGTYYLDRGKYPHMTFCNFDLNLINKAKIICESFSEKKIKISSRKRKTGIEYSFNIPVVVVKMLLELGFNKKKIHESIINDKDSICLLKGFYEADGTNHESQIYIYQNNAAQLLKDCQKIANLNGLSAHIHTSNREGEQHLVIENSDVIKKLFGRTIKEIKDFKPQKNSYHKVKRFILNFLKESKYKQTSEIYKFLIKNGVKLEPRSIIPHLNELSNFGLLEKQTSIIKRNKLGQFIKSECKWNLKFNLTKEQIMNFPYGVLK